MWRNGVREEQEKASRGSYEKFMRLMSKVPAVEPPEYDRF